MTEKEWKYYKRYLSDLCVAVIGKSIPVEDIEPCNVGELGYTTPTPSIHLAKEHEIMKDLSPKEKKVFIMGVFAHELLHQIFSDFRVLKDTLSSYSRMEQKILADISNLLEDPAIEYFAPSVIGGDLLKALQYTILTIYKNTKNLEESQHPFSQYINALIQFGDMGFLKGYFTYDDSKKIFNETVSLFNQGIAEPSPSQRMKISVDIMEKTRPLWEQDAKSFNEMIKNLNQELNKNGKNLLEEASSPMFTEEEIAENLEEIQQNSKCKKREDLINEIDNERKSQTSSNTSEKSLENESSLTNQDELTTDSTQKETNNLKGDEPSDNCSPSNLNKTDDGDEESVDSISNNEKTKDETTLHTHSSSQIRNEKSRINNDRGSLPSIDFSETQKERLTEEQGVKDFSEYELSATEIDEITNNAKEEIEKYKVKDAMQKKNDQIENIRFDKSFLNKARVSNVNVKIHEKDMISLSKQYAKVKEKLNYQIQYLKKSLKDIFTEDQEERDYTKSGKINLKRVYTQTSSPRVFNRYRDPNDKSDCAIVLLIDESGSMGSDKSHAAKQCAIILAEVCEYFKIPIYILGFTTGNSYDAIHYHYIHWKNTKSERLKLLNITGRNCNFDGYSIRYAGEILKKKKVSHKLLIVISDGTPSHCLAGMNSVKDTKDAVAEVRKYASVLGISIQNGDKHILHSFYGNDFIHVDKITELAPNFVKKIKKIISNWK